MVSETNTLVSSDDDGKLGLATDCRLLAKTEEALRESKNFSFNDFCKLIEMAGFVLDRINGDHYIYKHPEYKITSPHSDMLNVQNVKGKAKPYQIRQFFEFITLAVRK